MSSLEEEYGRKTRIIRVDFTDSYSIYPAIAEELRGLEIGILGNVEQLSPGKLMERDDVLT